MYVQYRKALENNFPHKIVLYTYIITSKWKAYSSWQSLKIEMIAVLKGKFNNCGRQRRTISLFEGLKLPLEVVGAPGAFKIRPIANWGQPDSSCSKSRLATHCLISFISEGNCKPFFSAQPTCSFKEWYSCNCMIQD